MNRRTELWQRHQGVGHVSDEHMLGLALCVREYWPFQLNSRYRFDVRRYILECHDCDTCHTQNVIIGHVSFSGVIWTRLLYTPQ